MLGFETVPFPGEDEGTFHLQRSETGDARLNREHQSHRVNQQTQYNTPAPPRRPAHQHHRPQQQQQSQQQTNQQPQYNPQSNNNQDKEFLRGSSSSNFFNNRNNGKENDDDYFDNQGAPNQNTDIPKKKIIRKFNQRKPIEDDFEPEARTSRPSRPTGFVNNFAGSVNPPSTTTIRTTPIEQYSIRGRQPVQRTRGGDRQYNNAETFRNNNNNDQQFNNNNNRNQSPASTPAPFRAVQRQTTQYDNGQYTTSSPKVTAPRQTFNQPSQTKQQTENYPSTPVVPKQQNFRQQDNYPSTPVVAKQSFRQPDNYPSTNNGNFGSQFTNKQTENYPTTPVFKKQAENYPSTATPFKQDYSKQTTQFKKTEPENYPTTANFNKQTFNNQFDVQKKPTTFKQQQQTENYPTTFAPKNYQKQSSTQYYQPKETENYPSQFSTNNSPSTKQFDNSRSPTTQFNNNPSTKQFDNTRAPTPQFNNNQFSTTIRPTTQHTQYTPTVPKQTTQYVASTTPGVQRFSKQFDETSYDDGSYNPKFDDEKYKSEDEFLKTAHSQNFASARNEFASSTKITTQSPRPFSATTPIPRTTNAQRQTQNVPKSTQTQQYQQQQPKQQQQQPKQQQQQTKPVSKKEKDVSYDYAYYDTNVSEPDYDVGTDFQKSTKKEN